MKYDITPHTYVRVTQKSKRFSKQWKNYCAWKTEVKLKRVELPAAGAKVTFIIPMPKSWSRKKQTEMWGKPHMQKPDLSNLLKALEDACYTEDKVIWKYLYLKKVWGKTGAIIIE